MSFRNVFIAFALLALAACSSTETTAPRVAVWQGEQTGLLYMRVLSEQPLRDARLTMPDGRHVLTQRLTQPEGTGRTGGGNDSWSRPTVGVGGSAGSSGGFGTGVGISFPMGGGGSSRPSAQATQAEFALTPDQMAQYRARPKDWLLELRFDNRIASMAAPALAP